MRKLEEYLSLLKEEKFTNYHKHCHYSNIMTIDSVVKPRNYVERAIELGHKMVFSTQHGIVNGYHEYYDVINTANDVIDLLKNKEEKKAVGLSEYIGINIDKFKKRLEENPDYKIKFGFGVEAYMVVDANEELKDRKNSHIVLLARNKKGFRSINKIISKGNTDQYYYKPRISIDDILTLDKKDIIITSACVGSYIRKYKDNGINITKLLHQNFKDSFYLEVQNHNTKLQKEYNKKILKLSNDLGIKLIAGTDSHVIYPEQEKLRDAFLKSKGLHYDDEEGWYLDYPNASILFDRFLKQGVLSAEQSFNSIINTNEIIEKTEEITFNKEKIKLPNVLYPNKTQKERDEIYRNELKKEWKKYIKRVDDDKKEYYKKEIRKEADVVTDTKMTDYFLLNQKITDRGINKYGGRLSKTGRGSAVSFFTNKLLGFTEVDRIAAKVTMFPSRFMSKTRILETKSLPDIDFNTADPDPFIKAQTDIMGEDHSYYMLAYGKLKVLSAWKVYAKAKGVSFHVANKVSKGLKEYKKKKGYSSNPEDVNPADYIPKEYVELFKASQELTGLIDSVSPSPCSHLLYDKPISEDVGLMRVGSKGKKIICAAIDGGTADDWKYLKNDLLTVSVWDVNYRVLEKLGLQDMTVMDLLEKTEGDKKTWDIYKNKATIGINQVEKAKTAKKCAKYKPKNESELSAFVAAIRPGFKSMIDTFLNREEFEYGIEDFDNLIQTKEIPNTFVIYQEQVMKTLVYTGFPEDQTYSLIKAISKKKENIIEDLEKEFKEKFIEKGNTEEDTNKIWQIILDNAKYSFNASHSYCVAIDSLFGAYLKAHYPFEFFEVMLDFYSEKKNADKISSIKTEMISQFAIDAGELIFGKNNAGWNAEKEESVIHQSLLGVKYLNQFVAKKIYEISQEDNYEDFFHLFRKISETKGFNKTHLEKLIQINYFKNFGKRKKLLAYYYIYKYFWKTIFRKSSLNKKLDKFKEKYVDEFNVDFDIDKIVPLIKKYAGNETEKSYTKMKRSELFVALLDLVPNEDLDYEQAIKIEANLLGVVNTLKDEDIVGKIIINSLRNKSFLLRSYRTGREEWFRYKSKSDVNKKPTKGKLILSKGIKMRHVNTRNGIEKQPFVVDAKVL